MTVGGDFIPVDDFDSDQPSYPVIFGIALTPTVGGVMLALIGAVGAGWLLLNLVLPALEANQLIRTEIETNRQQLVDQTEIQQQIEQARLDLEEAEQLRADVLALFADEASLDTLLLDLNARVQGAEVVTPGPDDATGGAAVLERFALVPGGTGGTDTDSLVTDGSFGVAADNKLQQRIYEVQINGTFGQTQSIIRNIERLRTLLVVRELTVRMANPPILRVNTQGQAQGQEEPRLVTTFRLIALVPPQELPASAPPPAPVDPNAPVDPAAAPAP